MTDLFAHQIAARAAGNTITVERVRNPGDGSERFAIVLNSRGDRWVSSFVFDEEEQAQIGAMVLRDFVLGAKGGLP
jgi:hypothetical protein